MNTPNSVLRQRALESLRGNFGISIALILIYFLISAAGGGIPGLNLIYAIIAAPPLLLGLSIYFLQVSRKKQLSIDLLFRGFDRFGVSIGAYWLKALLVILWSLLLIIPGIIAAYSYSMTNFIIADNPDIGAVDAINKSKEMMRGYKMKLFLLHLSFIGWFFLCSLTLGIGLLWLIPYVQTSQAKFYEELIGENQSFGNNDDVLDSNVSY